MKKSILTNIFFLLLVSIFSFSCVEPESNSEYIYGNHISTIQSSKKTNLHVYLYVIDDCEYIGYFRALTHKGNCKYCAKRLEDSNPTRK